MELQGKKVLVNSAEGFRCSLALYCVGVTAAFLVWVAGSAGLGPLDDHHIIRTIFQGKEFGYYVSPELGRFFPLTAQEYVVAAKLFGPSGEMFYLLNAFKLIFCGGLLYFCLVSTELACFASAVLWSIVMFSMGIANTLFRLSAGEFNALILLLLFAWCVLKLRDRQGLSASMQKVFATVGFSAFFIALFYKELIFVFGLIFSLSEIVRALWSKKSSPTVFIMATLLTSLVYIVTYGIWHFSHVTGSYANFHTTSTLGVLKLFASNDPFIIFIILPVTAYRGVSILRRPEQYSIYDSFLLAASAYVCAFLVLAIFSPYYLLPTYAFAVCGLAGILAGYLHKIVQRTILAFVLLFGINIFPLAFSDTQFQKLINHNHFPFVNFLSGWLQTDESVSQSRNIVLAGVSTGSGVEILISIKIFLVSLGVPESTFEVKATEPSDNNTISDFYGFKTKQGYQPKVNDLLIFNPYRQATTVLPPLQAPSYKEVYHSDREWALPRWMMWDWIKFCLINRAGCTNRVSNNMRYGGYAAMLVMREPLPVTEALPLNAPSYLLGALFVPGRIKSGTTRNLDVLVQNTGTETWPVSGALRAGKFVYLSYRWFDKNNLVVLEGGRAAFPEPMRPKDMAKVSVLLKTPKQPGKYKLVISPVQEDVRWFYLDNNIDIGKQIEIF